MAHSIAWAMNAITRITSGDVKKSIGANIIVPSAY